MFQVAKHLKESEKEFRESQKEFRESLQEVRGSLHRLEKGQQVLQSEFSDLVERQLRGDIRRLFGDQYAKGLLARSIIDFVHSSRFGPYSQSSMT